MAAMAVRERGSENMGRLPDDATGDESLIAWLRVMFPEARAESVFGPAGYLQEKADLKNPGTGGKHSLYGLLSQLFPGRYPRLPRMRLSR